MILVHFFAHFPAVFATAFAINRPIKPDCYHCLRIHIFVWKKVCYSSQKARSSVVGSGGMRPLEDFYVHFGHFGHFPTAVFNLFCSQ